MYNKHIPKIYIEIASIKHHLIKHGYNEYRVNNYINLGLNLKQSTLLEYRGLYEF